MPKRARELTAFEVRRLSRQLGMHAVGGVAGLHLQVQSPTSASWILRIKVAARRPDIGLGSFGDVTLEHARKRAREIHEQVKAGTDPLAARRAAKAALTVAQGKRKSFDDAARACWEARAQEFSNGKHANQWINTLLTYASPTLGRLPVSEIEVAHVMKVLEPIWSTKTETATRVRGRVESVLDWARTAGYREGENPARWETLKHLLPKPSKIKRVKHHPALPWAELPEFMPRLANQDGIAARALEFAILTAARGREVRFAKRADIDLVAKVWTVPAAYMKNRRVHRVPLSDIAVELIQKLPSATEYLFPAPRGGVLTDMAMLEVCRRMGVDEHAVPHGFRSTFKDWARNRTRYPDELTELALSHVNSDETRAAYARDELLGPRRPLMRDWAKYAYSGKRAGNNVVALQARA